MRTVKSRTYLRTAYRELNGHIIGTRFLKMCMTFICNTRRIFAWSNNTHLSFKPAAAPLSIALLFAVLPGLPAPITVRRWRRDN